MHGTGLVQEGVNSTEDNQRNFTKEKTPALGS